MAPEALTLPLIHITGKRRETPESPEPAAASLMGAVFAKTTARMQPMGGTDIVFPDPCFRTKEQGKVVHES